MKPVKASADMDIRPINIHVTGARLVEDSADGVTLSVPLSEVRVNWLEVTKELVTSGIDQIEAERYVEEFAEQVYIRELSRALAKMVRRA